MQKISIEEAIEQIVKKDGRYHTDAYQFVREALDFTVKQQKKGGAIQQQHISVAELLQGIREYALQQFGPLALTVLNYWNIRVCEDFGEVVFNMVSMRILKITEKDTREDFKNGYDFDETFLRPFEPSQKPARRSSAKTRLNPKSTS